MIVFRQYEKQEKYEDYSLLTLDMIESYLRKQVFENADDIKIRKLLINTFVREVRLYDDKVIILLNFIPPIDQPKFTIEDNVETERQINSALSNTHNSCIYPYSAPYKNHEPREIKVRVFFDINWFGVEIKNIAEFLNISLDKVCKHRRKFKDRYLIYKNTK